MSEVELSRAFCTQIETIWKILWAFGDDFMRIMQIKEWYNQFENCWTMVESNSCSGRPSTSRNDNVIDELQTLFMQYYRSTIREVADEVGISTGSVYSILSELLALWRVSAKFVPKLLTIEQKELGLQERWVGHCIGCPFYFHSV